MMSQCFPKWNENFAGNVKAELGLFNYVKMTNLKAAPVTDTSMLTLKTSLFSLKIKSKLLFPM